MKEVIEDVQSRPDSRAIALDAAGVRRLKHPYVLVTSAIASQPIVAEMSLSCSVPANLKGTHMSRFVEAAAVVKQMSAMGIADLANEVQRRLASPDVSVEATFVVLARAPRAGHRRPRLGRLPRRLELPQRPGRRHERRYMCR